MVKLSIRFEELVAAFEQSSATNHYFIDTEEGRMIHIDDRAGKERNEKPVQIDEKRHIAIPPKTPESDFFTMESFVYEIAEKDFELSEKFNDLLEKRRPSENFCTVLKENDLEEKWHAFKKKEMENHIINWLVENDIELEDQKLIPDIEIKELTKEEIEKLPSEIREFTPVACMDCDNKEGLGQRFFELNVPTENALVEKETGRIMKEKYGVEHCGHWGGYKKEVLTASKCPECGSENVFEDY